MEKPTEVQFANDKVKEAFENLDDSKFKQFLERAFEDIKANPFCGIQIPKKLIPAEYVRKFKI